MPHRASAATFAGMWIDIAFAIIASVAFYYGFSRGIIRTIISVAAVFVGFILAVRFAAPVTDVISRLFNTSPDGAMPLIGFIVAFVLVLALLRLLATFIERVLTKLRLNALNKVAGGLATAILGTLVLSILLLFVESANLITPEAKRESVTYQSLAEFPAQAYAILGKARPGLERVRDAGKKALDEREE